MNWLRIIADGLLIGCGIALLAAFVAIHYGGSFTVVEATPLVLFLETVLAIVVIVLGIVMFARDLR